MLDPRMKEKDLLLHNLTIIMKLVKYKIMWARRAPPSLIDYFICRYATSSLIFCTKPYMDVNKGLYSEWPCLIEVLDFILLQVVTPRFNSTRSLLPRHLRAIYVQEYIFPGISEPYTVL
jgi:hypothetical protein